MLAQSARHLTRDHRTYRTYRTWTLEVNLLAGQPVDGTLDDTLKNLEETSKHVQSPFTS